MTCRVEVSEHTFRNWFSESSYSGNFTFEQLGLLYDYLDELVDEDGFSVYSDDIVAVCCDFSGYDEVELMEAYATEDRPEIDDVLAYLEGETTVVWDATKDNFIIREF